MILLDFSVPELECFWQYVEYWANIEPDFPTMRYNDQVITSQQFQDRTKQLAQAFLDLGIQKGDRIVTVLPCIPEFMLTFVAANKIGAITVPMDIRYRHTDFLNLIPGLEPKLIVSVVEDDEVNFANILKNLQKEVSHLQSVIFVFLGKTSYGLSFQGLLSAEYNNLETLQQKKLEQNSMDDTLIIWTGGTTGLPKAALLSNKNIVRMCVLEDEMIRNVIHSKGVEGRTKLLANLPVSHVGGTVEILGVGVVGGHEIILHDKWSATKTLQTFHKERIPFYLGAPTMYRIMMVHEDLTSFDLSGLKLAMISGEIVNSEFMDLMQKHICKTIVNGYGSTEMGPEVTFTEPDRDYNKITSGYVGKPLKGMELKIQTLESKEAKTGEIGEVLVKGDLVAKGYFRNPEENRRSYDGDYFKTGDLGKLDDDGGLWLTGRIKEVIRVGAYTVLPQEIEEVVFQHFKLDMAAGLSIPDEMHGEVVWLAITPKEGIDITEDEVIALCEKELANYKVPKRVIFYEIDPDNPPVTRISKIDRLRIRNEVLGIDSS
ncbi:MAG: class I adenylate-forming enzyme family protein [Candidatus Kariarchaeaceae archaeon]